MRKHLFFLFTPLLLSINMLFIFLNGCNKCGPNMCGYYNSAILIPLDNADSLSKTPAASGVLAKAFLLLLTIEDTTYQCVRESSIFPANTAYAECLKGARLARLDSIFLTSDHDFDSAHPAGTDLKRLFNITDTAYVNYIHVGRNNFYLLHEPADTGTHVFTIRIFMHDSTSARSLTATSQPVKLLL